MVRVVLSTVVVKKVLSCQPKLLIFCSFDVLILTYAHELWVSTKRTRPWIQAAEMRFFQRVAVPNLRDRVRELRHPERAQGRAAAPW